MFFLSKKWTAVLCIAFGLLSAGVDAMQRKPTIQTDSGRQECTEPQEDSQVRPVHVAEGGVLCAVAIASFSYPVLVPAVIAAGTCIAVSTLSSWMTNRGFDETLITATEAGTTGALASSSSTLVSAVLPASTNAYIATASAGAASGGVVATMNCKPGAPKGRALLSGAAAGAFVALVTQWITDLLATCEESRLSITQLQRENQALAEGLEQAEEIQELSSVRREMLEARIAELEALPDQCFTQLDRVRTAFSELEREAMDLQNRIVELTAKLIRKIAKNKTQCHCEQKVAELQAGIGVLEKELKRAEAVCGHAQAKLAKLVQTLGLQRGNQTVSVQ